MEACYNGCKEASSDNKHIRKVAVPQGCLELTCLVMLYGHSPSPVGPVFPDGENY